MSVLHLDNITLQFGQRRIFDGLELMLQEQEIVCVETGVLDGGSSLLKVAAGLYQPDSGRVWVNGKALDTFSEQERFRASCMCFEDGGLLSLFSNFNNIAFPLLYHTRLKAAEIEQRIVDLAKRLSITELLPLEPHQLNDVQTRMMNLLRALVFRPAVILLDEIQAGMSHAMRDQMLDTLMSEQKEHGFSVVMTVTAGSVVNFASRLLAISQGRLEQKS